MKQTLFLLFLITPLLLFAQVTDDFSDGDFSVNPTWAGTDADYIINGSMELQLNNTIAATSYLSTAHGLANLDNKEWRFTVKQTFAPSGSNFGRVYLTASSSDLSTDPDGFYLLFGEAGSADAVRLFKVQSGTHTEILAGPAAQIASSFNLGVKVVRDNTGLWELFIDAAGGTSYTLEGSVSDATALTGTHFGVYDVYTLSNATKFYYDDFYVGDEVLDLTPPSLVNVAAIDASNIDLFFDEALESVSASDPNNYDIQPFLSATNAVLDGVNPSIVHLTLTAPMTNGSTYNVFAYNMQDLSGNIDPTQNLPLTYILPEVPVPGDLVINEFFCDPSPVIGLPEAEFVEIYNRSSKIFDVENWKLGDASSDGTVQQGWLLPGEFIVLTSTAFVDSFPNGIAVTSFPSLNNSGDNIVLRSDLGVRLDSIAYTIDWYHDASKESGGYSIERINPNDPCSDIYDWSASLSSTGGTPGAQNSVYDSTPDNTNPSIDQLIALAPSYLEVYFTEGMDSSSLVNALVSTSPSLTVQTIYALETFPSMATIQFQEVFTPSQIYNITLENVADCWANTTTLVGNFSLPEAIAPGDLVINEILFNPITGGSDWVELYNASDKLLDLYQAEFANFDNDTISNNDVVNDHFLISPGDYVVISEDTTHILQNFTAAVPGRFVQSDLPSYSNEEGTVYLIVNGTVIDAVSYSSDWHFQLLDNEDGKSLERIEPDGPSSDGNNWHTAAESIGFGTPGRVNSQYYPAITNGVFSYTSESISPDSDGFEDVLQVNYQMSGPGFVGTFTVYDDRGRLIATVLQSELLATEGTFVWKGVADDGSKASIGTYVGVFEAFDIEGGAVFASRKAFVVAGNL